MPISPVRPATTELVHFLQDCHTPDLDPDHRDYFSCRAGEWKMLSRLVALQLAADGLAEIFDGSRAMALKMGRGHVTGSIERIQGRSYE